MGHLIPAPAALVTPVKSRLLCACPGLDTNEVVPPCFSDPCCWFGPQLALAHAKDVDPPNPNKSDIDVYPWLGGGSVRSSVITPLRYNYWSCPGRGRPITRPSIVSRPPIGSLISTSAHSQAHQLAILWLLSERLSITARPLSSFRLHCTYWPSSARHERFEARLIVINHSSVATGERRVFLLTNQLLVLVGRESDQSHQSTWLLPTFTDFIGGPLLIIDPRRCLTTAHPI